MELFIPYPVSQQITFAMVGRDGPITWGGSTVIAETRVLDGRRIAFVERRTCPARANDRYLVALPGALSVDEVRLISTSDETCPAANTTLPPCGTKPEVVDTVRDTAAGSYLHEGSIGGHINNELLAVSLLEETLAQGKRLGLFAQRGPQPYQVVSPEFTCRGFVEHPKQVQQFGVSNVYITRDVCSNKGQVWLTRNLAAQFPAAVPRDPELRLIEAHAVVLRPKDIPACSADPIVDERWPPAPRAPATKSTLTLPACPPSPDDVTSKWMPMRVVKSATDLKAPGQKPHQATEALLREVRLFGDQIVIPPAKYFTDNPGKLTADSPDRFGALDRVFPMDKRVFNSRPEYLKEPCLDPSGTARVTWRSETRIKSYNERTGRCETTTIVHNNAYGFRVPIGTPVLGRTVTVDAGSCEPKMWRRPDRDKPPPTKNGT